MTDSICADVMMFPPRTNFPATLEVCVGDIAGLDAAISGGADRIELCSALSVGGLSPSPALILAAAATPVPVHMLIRPRDGDFRYTAREVEMIAADIDAAAQSGLAGVVIGASSDDRTLDASLLRQLVGHARRERRLSITLHRAFDLCPNLAEALETAIALGFDRILTSGGAPKASDALPTLAALHRQAVDRIIIMAGSGISPASIEGVIATGIREIHASCSSEIVADETLEHRFGFVANHRRYTDAAVIRKLREAINRNQAPQGA